MKKLILLGLATLTTFSASAQIDGFDESELVTTNLNSEQFDKSIYMTPNCNRLELLNHRIITNAFSVGSGSTRDWSFNHSFERTEKITYEDIYDIRNEQIYSTINPNSDYYRNIWLKQNGYDVVVCKKFILTMDIAMQSFGIEPFKLGEYYEVVDILITKEQFEVWKDRINKCQVFIGDTVHKMVGKKMKPITIDKRFLSIPTTDDQTGKMIYDYRLFLIDLPSESEYIPIVLPNGDIKEPSKAKFYGNAIYVLKKDNKYYFVSRFSGKDSWDKQSTISTIEYKYTTYGKLVTIDDFISVNGLNTMKKIFENKILTEGTDTTKLFTCKKIAPKDGIIQGLFFNLSTNQTIFSPISTHGIAPMYWAFEHHMASGKSEKDLNEYSYDIHILNNQYCIKAEIDSVLNLKHMRELEKERLKNLQDSEEQKRIITKYGEQYGKLIVKGEVCLGMAKDMCLEALGYPCKENSSVTGLGKIEVWTYDCFWFEQGLIPNLTHITFTNGKISGITKLSE